MVRNTETNFWLNIYKKKTCEATEKTCEDSSRNYQVSKRMNYAERMNVLRLFGLKKKLRGNFIIIKSEGKLYTVCWLEKAAMYLNQSQKKQYKLLGEDL